MEKYITGDGQRVNVHTKDQCEEQDCVIHNPSNHHMNGWPTHWRDDKGLMERICIHGIGHPDPDCIKFQISTYLVHRIPGWQNLSIHGCDGCCNKDMLKD